MPFLTKQTEEILKTEGGGKLFLKAKSLFFTLDESFFFSKQEWEA